MKRFAILTVLLSCSCGRDAPPSARLSVVGDVREGYPRIFLAPDLVYRFSGEVVETIDVSDPRDGEVVGEADVPVNCGTVFSYLCQGLLVEGQHAYVQDTASLARTRLPDGAGAAWRYLSPSIAPGRLRSIPGGIVVPAGSGPDDYSPVLHFFETGGADPVEVASLSLAAVSLTAQGFEVSLATTGGEFVRIDASDISNPIELSRKPIDFGDLEATSTLWYLSVEGDSAFGLVPGPGSCSVLWFSIGTDGSLTATDARGGLSSLCNGLAVTEDFVLVASDNPPTIETIRIDRETRTFQGQASQGLASNVTDVAVDEERRLVFAATYEAVEIFDLDRLGD